MRKSLFTGTTWSSLSYVIFIPYSPHPPSSTLSFFNFFSGFLPTAVTWLVLTLKAKVVNKNKSHPELQLRMTRKSVSIACR